MNLSTWSIHNPIPVIALFVLLTIAGAYGFMNIRVNSNADIDIPIINVSVSLPGASPSELETEVTRLIEDAVTGIDNIKHIRSTVTEGMSSTQIEFVLGEDMDSAVNDVRNSVSRVRAQLPDEISEPVVQLIENIGRPIYIFAVVAPHLTPEEISWLIDQDITSALLSVPGVSKVQREGGVNREIRVHLRPQKLAALGVSAGTVSAQLRQINANLPSGRATLGTSEHSIRAVGSVRTVQELAATRLNLPDGRHVRLSDLGRVEDSWSEQRSLTRYNGREVIAFNVMRGMASGELEVAEQSVAVLDQFAEDHPGVTFIPVFTTSEYTREGYVASLEALALAGLLAVLVIWIFLRDPRATFITALSLPLSLVPSLAVLFLFGFSLNMVTLVTLALMVGVLVDDSIVEVENIVRHVRRGQAVFDASIEASNEIGLAVIATTFTLVAIFFPTLFMPGMVGQNFVYFGATAIIAALFSLLVARMLTPLMGAYLLKPDHREEDAPFWLPRYLKALNWSLVHRRLVLLGGIGIFAASLGLTVLLPSEFIPTIDRGTSQLSIELPPGATLEETDAVAQKISGILMDIPEVASVNVTTGAGGAVRKASMWLTYIPRNERDFSAQELEVIARGKVKDIPGVRLRFGGSASSGGGGGYQLALSGSDPELLSQGVLAIERELRTLPLLHNVASTASLGQPEVIITPKPDQAARLGVSTRTIADVARIATLGDTSSRLPKFNLADRQIPVRVMLEETARDDLETISLLRVPSKTGASVPLSAVAEVSFGAGPAQLNRLDRSRSITIEAETSGIPIGVVEAAVAELPIMQNLPAGVHITPIGQSEAMQDLFGGFIVAVTGGILLMYLVLVLLFKGFAHPFTILTSLPLAIGGTFGLLLIAGMSISVTSLVGIFLMLGIAAKNSILIVDYVLVAQESGMPRHEALMDAARKRARPVVMTSMAMIAGMMPVALGVGADSEFRSPMAVAVIGGLISSTALSLIYVPVAFTYVDGLQQRLAARLRFLLPAT